MKKLVFILGLLIVSLSHAANLVSISGTIFTNGYSPITASVTAENLSTNKSYTSTVNSNGTFKIDSLPKGNYKLYCSPLDIMSSFFRLTYYAQKPNAVGADILPLEFPIINLELYLLNQFVTANNTNIDFEKVKPSIYPNPFSANLSFENDTQRLIIYNTLGQIQFQNRNSIDTIDTSEWESGTYFAKIENEMYRLVKE